MSRVLNLAALAVSLGGCQRASLPKAAQAAPASRGAAQTKIALKIALQTATLEISEKAIDPF